MTRVLVARGIVAGRPYTLAVGLYGLAVRVRDLDRQPLEHPTVVVHQPVASLAAATNVIDIVRALTY